MERRNRVVLFLSVICFVFLGGYGGVRSASPQPAAPRKELPSFHYLFAHNQLPKVLHANPQLGLALAFSTDRQDLLLRIWGHCREIFPEFERNNDPAGLAVKGETIADDVAIAVITMPQPHNTPEAYYICVITRFTLGNGGAATALDIDYYTLEKSINLFGPSGNGPAGQTESVPTVIGSWDKDHNHSNYGEGPAPDSPDEFVSAVVKLYAKKVR
jgi:hypothetical protein